MRASSASSKALLHLGTVFDASQQGLAAGMGRSRGLALGASQREVEIESGTTPIARWYRGWLSISVRFRIRVELAV